MLEQQVLHAWVSTVHNAWCCAGGALCDVCELQLVWLIRPLIVNCHCCCETVRITTHEYSTVLLAARQSAQCHPSQLLCQPVTMATWLLVTAIDCLTHSLGKGCCSGSVSFGRTGVLLSMYVCSSPMCIEVIGQWPWVGHRSGNNCFPAFSSVTYQPAGPPVQ